MAEITVMLSAAFKPAYLELVPQFERATGHTARQPQAARALVEWFTTPVAAPVITRHGMAPA